MLPIQRRQNNIMNLALCIISLPAKGFRIRQEFHLTQIVRMGQIHTLCGDCTLRSQGNKACLNGLPTNFAAIEVIEQTFCILVNDESNVTVTQTAEKCQILQT